MPHVLAHEPDAHRYTLSNDGQLIAVADYVLDGHAISFTHTVTQPEERGSGRAAELVTFAMDDVETSTRLRVVPRCWDVAHWFDGHPERAHLLTR